jgi:hypothetical protein
MDEPLKALERLGDEFERMALGDERRGARRRGRRSILALALVTLLVLAAVAVAAGGLLTGEPLENPHGVTFSPKTGLGTPVAGTAKLQALRVADPDGGPPWAIRTLATTRGYGCAQLGRVVDGKLGVLGQDGAFANDGKFHEKAPDVLSGTDCQQTDGAGHAFLAVSYQGMPASGLDRGCLARAQRVLLTAPGGSASESAPDSATAWPVCPAADERIIYYGMLGPQGKSVTYADEQGRHVRAAAAGPDGAYVVVLRPRARQAVRGGFSFSLAPGSGLLSVQYRDGSVCHIRSPRMVGGAKACPLKGYVAPHVPTVTRAQLRAPVRLTVSSKPVKPPVPAEDPAPQMLDWRITVSFRARVAGDARSYYVVSLGFTHVHGCKSRGTMLGPVARDVKVGRRVRVPFYLPAACRGPVHAAVAFHQQHGKPDQVPFIGRPGHDPEVGSADATLG